MVRLVCPSCGTDFTAPDTIRAGDKTTCSNCGFEFSVPAAAVIATDVHAALRDDAQWETLPEDPAPRKLRAESKVSVPWVLALAVLAAWAVLAYWMAR